MSLHATVLVLYLGFLFAFGIAKTGRVRTQADFAVAGRGLSPFVLVGTMLATWIGTGSIFGNAERTYEVGIATWFFPIPSMLGIVILALLARRIRRVEGFTVQDILEARFGVGARLLGTITLVLAYVTIVSYQFRAAGLVLNLAVPEIPFETAVIISAIAIVLYTAVAGLKSVAHTDVINGILMVVGIGVLIPVFFVKAGGFDGVAAALPEDHRQLMGPFSPIEMLGLFLPAFLLVLGDANMFQRFFSARDERAAQTAARWLVLGVVLVDGGIIVAAWLASALEPGLDDPGKVIAYAGLHHLPPLGSALLLAVILAIIVSTADSFILVTSTCLVRDVYQRFLKRDASEISLVWASRAAVVVVGGWAFVQSTFSDEFLSVAFYAYTIYGAGITPSILAGLLWKRARAAGAVASIVGGTATTLTWELRGMAASTGIEAVVPAIVVSTALLVGVSLAVGGKYSEE